MTSPDPTDVRPHGNVDGAWPSPRAAFRPRLWQLAIAAIIFVWLLVDVLLTGPVRRLDRVIAPELLELGMRDHPVLSYVGFWLSQAGGRGTNLIWIGILCAVILSRQRTLVPAAKLLSASGVMVVVVYPFKEWLSRSYPADPAGDYFHAAGQYGGAFPSGHMANATALASVGAWIAMTHFREVWVQRVVGSYALAAPFITAVAVLLMSYHWLSDVVAGTCLGVLVLALVRWFWGTAAGRRLEELLTFEPR